MLPPEHETTWDQQVAATRQAIAVWRTAHLRQQTRQVATTRRALRRSAAPPIALPRPLPPRPLPAPPVPEAVLRLRQEERERPKRIVNGRPTADHPFKRALHARPAVPASPSLPKL